jgi:hypothetical protein
MSRSTDDAWNKSVSIVQDIIFLLYEIYLQYVGATRQDLTAGIFVRD